METTMSIWLINLATVAGIMTIGWVVSVIRRNVTVVDSLWGLGFAVIAVVTHWLGDGYGVRSLLVMGMTVIWGLRLSLYLTWRNWGKAEDHRYGQWRRQSGASFWWVSLFKVFWLQAIFLWVIALVLQQAQLAAAPPALTLLDGLGVGVWTVGLVFEAVGDWQLARFKADPANRGQVMDRGLWAWSRHPNYFGECLIWWGFYLIALGTPNGWWTVIAPITVTLVLLKMTGVPLTEAASKQRRAGYADYVKRTSPFFPRPPRKEAT